MSIDRGTKPGVSAPRTAEQRLIELEMSLMHLQRDFEALNAVVLDHQALIERQRREIERLERLLLNDLNDEVEPDPSVG